MRRFLAASLLPLAVTLLGSTAAPAPAQPHGLAQLKQRLQLHKPGNGTKAQPAVKKKPPPQPKLTIRDKWAILVGVGNFQDPSFQPLKFAGRDLAQLDSVLKNPNFGRFRSDHIELARDSQATTSHIDLIEERLFKKALPNDMILVYLVGRSQCRQNDVFFVPYDGRPELADNSGISIAELFSEIRRRTQSKNIIGLLDLSPIATAKSGSDTEKSPAVNLDELSKKAAVTLLSANALDQPSLESGIDTSSLFAHYLAEGIKTGGGSMSLATIAQYVAESAAGDAQKQAGTAQTAILALNPDNQDIKEIALGVAPKVPGGPPPLEFGYHLDNLALTRPDLLKAASPGGRASAGAGEKSLKTEEPAREQDEDDDESDAQFGETVNYSAYMTKMKRDIQAKWSPPKGLEQRTVVCVFSIARDGSILEPEVTESSGVETIDQSALAALKAASPLDPLPKGAPKSIQIRYKFDWRVSHN